MKGLRLLLLLGVTVMLAAVVSDYLDSRQANLSVRLAEPEKIPSGLNSRSSRWRWSQSSGSQRTIEISADSARQTNDNRLELTAVELRIFHEDEQTFDRVVSERAFFDPQTGELHSEVEVVVTLGLSVDSQEDAGKQPTKIRSTGVTFHSKAATCDTDRYTEYEFEGGRGHSTGAFYDSIHRVFQMKSDVYLERFPTRAGEPLVKVRAGELFYHEREQRIDLKGGASLERGTERWDPAEARVFLEEGLVRRIEAIDAVGSNRQAKRVARFRARWLDVTYSPSQILEHVTGVGAAELTSDAVSSHTKVNGERIDLHYVTPAGSSESVLHEAHVREGATIEFRPLASSDAGASHIRRVAAEWIQLIMRENGEDIRFLETLTPGRLELLPQNPKDWKRRLEAERIKAHYAPRNRMEKLEASGRVSLESLPPARLRPAGGAPLRSWSDRLVADFDTNSGQMRQLQQFTNFRFERGERRGHSAEARFDPNGNQIELKREATVSDRSGSVSANHIVLDENTGDFTAEVSVSSTYQESTPLGSGESRGSPTFFSATEPVFATADRMVSRQKTGQLDYEGRVRLWQGSERIEAERIQIDRRAQTLSAEGDVFSILRVEDRQEEVPDQVLTAEVDSSTMLIKADSMTYAEQTRRAVYQGNVELRRARLIVNSDKLEGVLHPPNHPESSGLQTAVAYGSVRIMEPGKGDRPSRRGFGHQAEYEPATETVHLMGQPARVVDQAGSETRGQELTYYVNDDRLLVLGSGENRSYTLRRRDPSR